MYAILKGRRGLPIALFQVTRETPKRLYGKIVDKLETTDRWMFLPGLTEVRGGESYVMKGIVQCILRTDRGWFENKDALRSTLKTYKTRYATLDERRQEFEAEMRDAQKATLLCAKHNAVQVLRDVAV